MGQGIEITAHDQLARSGTVGQPPDKGVKRGGKPIVPLKRYIQDAIERSLWQRRDCLINNAGVVAVKHNWYDNPQYIWVSALKPLFQFSKFKRT